MHLRFFPTPHPMDSRDHPLSLRSMNPWALASFALAGFIVGYAANEIVSTAGAGPGRGGAPTQQVALPSPPSPVAPPAPTIVANPPTADDDAVLGKKDAPVTLIEFTDYQCPFCARHFTQTFGEIRTQYVDTGKAQYIVRDFPLSIHPNAQKAAEATECADDQGKFWEMHDKLFQNQQLWSSAPNAGELFTQYATELQLNGETFSTCLTSGTYAEEVQKDFSDGSAGGVSGTPAFFVNGKKLSGAQPFASFQAAIEAELSAAK